MLLKNSSQVENLLNALSEEKGWGMNSGKDHRTWDKYVMNGLTEEGRGKRQSKTKSS